METVTAQWAAGPVVKQQSLMFPEDFDHLRDVEFFLDSVDTDAEFVDVDVDNLVYALHRRC